MSNIIHPPKTWQAVTPSNITNLSTSSSCTCLYVGVTGDVAVETQLGDQVTFVNVPAGTFLVGVFTKVRTATSASSILAGLI